MSLLAAVLLLWGKMSWGLEPLGQVWYGQKLTDSVPPGFTLGPATAVFVCKFNDRAWEGGPMVTWKPLS